MQNLNLNSKSVNMQFVGELSKTDWVNMILNGDWKERHFLFIPWQEMRKELSWPKTKYFYIVEANLLENILLIEREKWKFEYTKKQSKLKIAKTPSNEFSNKNLLSSDNDLFCNDSTLPKKKSSKSKKSWKLDCVYGRRLKPNLEYGVDYFALTPKVYEFFKRDYDLGPDIVRYVTYDDNDVKKHYPYLEVDLHLINLVDKYSNSFDEKQMQVRYTDTVKDLKKRVEELIKRKDFELYTLYCNHASSTDFPQKCTSLWKHEKMMLNRRVHEYEIHEYKIDILYYNIINTLSIQEEAKVQNYETQSKIENFSKSNTSQFDELSNNCYIHHTSQNNQKDQKSQPTYEDIKNSKHRNSSEE